MAAKDRWTIVSHVIEKKFDFEGRVFGKTGRPMVAVDPVNTMLNCGY